MKALALGVVAACSSAEPRHLELVDGPAVADLRPIVAGELARTLGAGKQLLVYVGATWCEPCRHFHDAATAGALDDAFGDLRLIVFDADRDAAALAAAGYVSELIPLFDTPRADGAATGRHIEGSIKGDGAVDEISPRLRALLDGQL